MSGSLDSEEALGRALQLAREAAGCSRVAAAAAIGLSPGAYACLEEGTRLLKGDDLVVLADLFGVRAAYITGMALCWPQEDDAAVPVSKMRERLCAYLELSSYLGDHGIAPA